MTHTGSRRSMAELDDVAVALCVLPYESYEVGRTRLSREHLRGSR